jgi:holliday junction DNA helicase RuvB
VTTHPPERHPERGFASEMLEAEGSYEADGSYDAQADGSYEATARVVDAAGSDDDRLVEAALRPKRLSEFPGQPRVREQLGLVLEAAKRRGSAPDHVLLSGPPGLGKTTLAMIVAAEIEKPIRVTSGPAIQHAGDLAAVLSSLDEGEVLFLDEIHRMSRSAEEMLYLAMEDFRVDVIVGKGPGATAIPLELPPFTVVGATTRAGLLPAPLRDRFGFTAHLDYYDTADLITILHRSARLLGVEADEAGIAEIAGRSRGTPRIANRLLRRVRDWAQVHGQGHVDHEAAHAALALFDVDDAGLDRLDRAVLEALCRRFGGGPVGLSTLAVAVGEESDTVETVAEPYLVREGYIVRTPRGRAAAARAWRHLGLEAPAGFLQQEALPLDGGPETGAGPGRFSG